VAVKIILIKEAFVIKVMMLLLHTFFHKLHLEEVQGIYFSKSNCSTSACNAGRWFTTAASFPEES